MPTDTRSLGPAAAGSAGRPRSSPKNWSNPLWIGAAVLGAAIFLQWPMVKGTFYKLAGVEAPSSTVAWHDDYQQAQAEATASGKPMLLVFSAAWCPACIAMHQEVWSDAEVGAVANAQFVPVYIDVDDRAQIEVARRYGVNAIPTVLVTDSDGKVLRQAASMSRTTALRFLSDQSAENRRG